MAVSLGGGHLLVGRWFASRVDDATGGRDGKQRLQALAGEQLRRLLRGAGTGYIQGMAPTAVKEAATERVKEAAKDRVAGDRPSPPRALMIALIVGIAAAAVTYKLLRS